MFIGILGGSFNPIHNGHLHIANFVHRTLALDRLIFVPTGDPPHKPATSLAPAHHRLEMVRLATESYPHFVVDDREARAPTVSYSIDTVQGIKHEFPTGTEFGFIIGLDAFLDFPSWKHATHLLEICQFIVCSRPGVAFSDLQSMPLLPPTPQSSLLNLDHQKSHRLDIALPSGNALTLLSVPPCEVSASQIREQIALHRPIGHWLPPSVESYIIRHQVYQ
ncbi:MAG: nicotinate-nucleotide adenylyltransferase [Nitrospirota bacterium]|nr:nicotinate-nucleotide adenylyltransferase [Nitrospirota bacterium]MDH5585820.1 nicotinate-nucleotide adenylyltransferase [Nitrospirota bacterium]MDH5775356.1 nicotinate-nucleotide adenylyltransferase [Nitrospirota bacterium]